MTSYIVRRLLLNVVVLWIVVTLVFAAVDLLPGDFVLRQAARNFPTADQAEAVARARKDLGLDRPLPVRYAAYLGGLARGDLGHSYETGRSTWTELGERLPATLELGAIILLVAFGLSLPVGVGSAVYQGTWLDLALRGLSVLAVATPSFFAAILGTLVVLKLGLWKIDIVGQPHAWEDPAAALRLYIIPGVAGGIAAGGTIMRLLRSQMLEVLRQDYIRTARAKGLRESRVWTQHALKNAMIPVLTVMGLTLANVFGGQVVLETMFNIHGVGQYTFSRLVARDFPPFQGAVVLLAAVLVTVNLLVDIAYGWLDPRVRYG